MTKQVYVVTKHQTGSDGIRKQSILGVADHMWSARLLAIRDARRRRDRIVMVDRYFDLGQVTTESETVYVIGLEQYLQWEGKRDDGR